MKRLNAAFSRQPALAGIVCYSLHIMHISNIINEMESTVYEHHSYIVFRFMLPTGVQPNNMLAVF